MKLHFALLAVSLIAGPALAQTAAKPAMAATPAKPATPATPAKPAMAATKTVATHTMTTKTRVRTAPSANTAVHTTKSGKTITYDCSKKGNMNKKACKK